MTTRTINTRNRLLKDKVCGCGEVYDRLPEGTKLSDDEGCGGYYWNCSCNSTLFIPTKYIAEYVSQESACDCSQCTDSDRPCDNDCGECAGCKEAAYDRDTIRWMGYVAMGGR